MLESSGIMDMLDWNMPPEVQSKGRCLAKKINTIVPFIQPLTPKYNKNVWENCALIIAMENDDKLKPYLVELLGWLQDMNWPGALCIHDRLQRYSDYNSIKCAIELCVKNAKECKDYIWEHNLHSFLQKYSK